MVHAILFDFFSSSIGVIKLLFFYEANWDSEWGMQKNIFIQPNPIYFDNFITPTFFTKKKKKIKAMLIRDDIAEAKSIFTRDFI